MAKHNRDRGNQNNKPKTPIQPKIEDKSRGRHNGLMDEQLYAFADYYYHASGRDRSYTKAALHAGAPESSAHVHGSQWAKLPQVQSYWQTLDKFSGAERRSAHKRSLLRLESHAENEQLEIQTRLGIEQTILDKTINAFDNGRGEWFSDFDHTLELERIKGKNALDLAPYAVEESRLKEAEKGRYLAEGNASEGVNAEVSSVKSKDIVMSTLAQITMSMEYHFGGGNQDGNDDN